MSFRVESTISVFHIFSTGSTRANFCPTAHFARQSTSFRAIERQSLVTGTMPKGCDLLRCPLVICLLSTRKARVPQSGRFWVWHLFSRELCPPLPWLMHEPQFEVFASAWQFFQSCWSLVSLSRNFVIRGKIS